MGRVRYRLREREIEKDRERGESDTGERDRWVERQWRETVVERQGQRER